MRPMLQRLTNRPASTKSVVHNQRQVMLLRQRHKRLNVRHRQSRIADGFKIDRFRLGINQRLKRLHLHAIREPRLNPNALERILELVVRATIKDFWGQALSARKIRSARSSTRILPGTAREKVGEDSLDECFDAEVSVVKQTRGFWCGFDDRFWA